VAGRVTPRDGTSQFTWRYGIQGAFGAVKPSTYTLAAALETRQIHWWMYWLILFTTSRFSVICLTTKGHVRCIHLELGSDGALVQGIPGTNRFTFALTSALLTDAVCTVVAGTSVVKMTSAFFIKKYIHFICKSIAD
jgi:hypothetical protein